MVSSISEVVQLRPFANLSKAFWKHKKTDRNAHQAGQCGHSCSNP